MLKSNQPWKNLLNFFNNIFHKKCLTNISHIIFFHTYKFRSHMHRMFSQFLWIFFWNYFHTFLKHANLYFKHCFWNIEEKIEEKHPLKNQKLETHLILLSLTYTNTFKSQKNLPSPTPTLLQCLVSHFVTINSPISSLHHP
jgi:hypothetical protein